MLKLKQLKVIKASPHIQKMLNPSVGCSKPVLPVINNATHYCESDGQRSSPLASWKAPRKSYNYQEANYSLPEKEVKCGSVEHFRKIQEDNVRRQERLKSVGTKVNAWKTDDARSNDRLNCGQTGIPDKVPEYGSVEHFRRVKDENFQRLKKLNSIETKVDAWNREDTKHMATMVPRSLEYGSVDHYKMIKEDSTARNRAMNHVKSKINTWNAPAHNSAYSAQRKDKWKHEMNPKKFGTVAHFQQSMVPYFYPNKVTTRISTWQSKDKMAVLKNTRQVHAAAEAEHVRALKQTMVTNFEHNKCLSKVTSRISTWQSKDKMLVLKIPRQVHGAADTEHVHFLKQTIRNATMKLNTGGSGGHNPSRIPLPVPAGSQGRPRPDCGQLQRWSRHEIPDTRYKAVLNQGAKERKSNQVSESQIKNILNYMYNPCITARMLQY